MRPICPICRSNSFPPSNHFGAVSCRACAAFFRRTITAKSRHLSCTCGQLCPAICRRCRMEKCLEAGMREALVKGHRDPIGSHLPPKSLVLLSAASQNYRILEADRAIVHKSDLPEIDMYQVSCVVRNDLKLVWKMLEATFGEFRDLPTGAKKQLFSNFYLKWSRLEAAIFAEKHKDPWGSYLASGQRATSIDKLYKDCQGQEGSKTSGEELRAVFEPYWRYHQEQVVQPLLQKNFDASENMALLALLLWDPAHSNLPEESVEMCHLMRKIVLRELQSHTKERRFIEAVDTLNLIDRAQFKAQEEVLMCSVYNIRLDCEFQAIVLESKF